mgnify:FL=1
MQELPKNTLLSGIKEGAAITGIGQFTKGLSIQVRSDHSVGSPSLSGDFRLLHGDFDTFICHHLPLGSEMLRDVATRISKPTKLNFENVRQLIIQHIGAEHNAEIINKHLFATSEWSLINI